MCEGGSLPEVSPLSLFPGLHYRCLLLLGAWGQAVDVDPPPPPQFLLPGMHRTQEVPTKPSQKLPPPPQGGLKVSKEPKGEKPLSPPLASPRAQKRERILLFSIFALSMIQLILVKFTFSEHLEDMLECFLLE